MHPICDACLLPNTFVNSYGPIMVFKGGLKLCSYGHLELCSFGPFSSISILTIDDLKSFVSFQLSQLCFLGLLSNYHILVFSMVLSCLCDFELSYFCCLTFLRSSTFY